MLGEKNSYMSRMISIQPNVIAVYCPAHLMSLCIRYAIEEIPDDIIDLISQMNSLFRSGKKKHDYKLFQAETGVPFHKVLRYHKIRWSSLFMCIERIIEQWDALLNFASTASDEKDPIGMIVPTPELLNKQECADSTDANEIKELIRNVQDWNLRHRSTYQDSTILPIRPVPPLRLRPRDATQGGQRNCLTPATRWSTRVVVDLECEAQREYFAVFFPVPRRPSSGDAARVRAL
ncbi:unnamed protein product [Trichogramma brassicae]|uniref:Uncharacterized protein n=1 Tax=Trichogramma brassicae TaxID=86971 RepID=A0A6H5J139_9HYME|nr:unnamed protein product [Trichogramma brassicae]